MLIPQRMPVFRIILIALLSALLFSCTKNKSPRQNFAEFIIDGKKFSFEKLVAIIDSTGGARVCSFEAETPSSNSKIDWQIRKPAKWLNDTYVYQPPYYSPDLPLTYLNIRLYTDRVPAYYSPFPTSVKLIIDQSDNGRIHGTFSGKLNCFSCAVYGQEAAMSGEFEMPYSYQ